MPKKKQVPTDRHLAITTSQKRKVAQNMTQTKDNDTKGLMTVRDVCAEYGITRAQAVNIMGMIPVKLQKHRANWFAIEDVEKLMNRYRSMWDRDYFTNKNHDYFDEERESKIREVREKLVKMRK